MAKVMLENKKIAVVGAGHMGVSLVEGFVESGIDPVHIIVSHPSQSHLRKIGNQWGVVCTTNNVTAVKDVGWILIAVKPAQVKEVMSEIVHNTHNKIILSVAAGIGIKQLENYCLDDGQKIVRLMPNIPVAKNCGVVGVLPNIFVSAADKRELTGLLGGLGEIIYFKKEQDLETCTQMSGCGPAIVSYFIELLMRFGNTHGLKENQSRLVALRTFEGTLKYLKKTGLTPSQLQKSVATKGGITEKILAAFEGKNIEKLFLDAMDPPGVK